MNTYKINKRFGHYEFNSKNLSHKIVWFEVGEVIEEKVFNRFSKATQSYCDKINTKKRKSSKKK
tara:strand:- start:1985 stop:2176 length:192 start_codon:yes stop_codon:yes gene_type:complete